MSLLLFETFITPIARETYIGNGSTDLHEIWYDDAYWAYEPEVKIFNFWKSKMAFTNGWTPDWAALTAGVPIQ